MRHRRRSIRPPLSFSSMIPRQCTFPTSATWRIACAKNLVFVVPLFVCNSDLVRKKIDAHSLEDRETTSFPGRLLVIHNRSTPYDVYHICSRFLYHDSVTCFYA